MRTGVWIVMLDFPASPLRHGASAEEWHTAFARCSHHFYRTYQPPALQYFDIVTGYGIKFSSVTEQGKSQTLARKMQT